VYVDENCYFPVIVVPIGKVNKSRYKQKPSICEGPSKVYSAKSTDDKGMSFLNSTRAIPFSFS